MSKNLSGVPLNVDKIKQNAPKVTKKDSDSEYLIESVK
jgi:hypothetical protein